MDDREMESAGHTESASDLLGIAAQLAALANDIKALAGKPIEQPSEPYDIGDAQQER